MPTSIDRLTALDQLMLRASKVWPQDIGALALLEEPTCSNRPAASDRGRARGDRVQAAFGPSVPAGRPCSAARAGWAAVGGCPVLRSQRARPGPSPSADSGEGGPPRLATERLRGRRLDPSRPLWALWFLTGCDNQDRPVRGCTIPSPTAWRRWRRSAPSSIPRRTPAPPAPRGHPRGRRRQQLLVDNLLAASRALTARARPLPDRGRPRGGCGRPGRRPASSSRSRHPRPAWTAWSVPAAPSHPNHPRPGQTGRACPAATVNDVLLAVTAGGLRALLPWRTGRGHHGADLRARLVARRMRGPSRAT